MKHPCSFGSCFDPCEAKAFYLQQIQGQGHLEKRGCPYTIFTACGAEFSNISAIERMEVCGEPNCTLLPGCSKNELLARVRIPLVLHLCSCSCSKTENAYIEDVVPVKFCGYKNDLRYCSPLAKACVKMLRNTCVCPSSAILDVSVQIFVLCGCVVHSSLPCSAFPDQKPWYPPPCNKLCR